MGEYYYPGLCERVMAHAENALTLKGPATAIDKLMENNEDIVVVGSHTPLHELAIQSGHCNWGMLEDRFFRDDWAFPFPKGSPFLPVFNEMWESMVK